MSERFDKAVEKGLNNAMHEAYLMAAVAVSLYSFNVPVTTRADKLYDHFGGACAEAEDIAEALVRYGPNWATALAAPTALIYIQHAMARYGEEAEHRVTVNLDACRDLLARCEKNSDAE